MNIGFIGYRNSGKSTLSKIIEESTNRRIFNTDQQISDQFQLDIPGIVEKFGWSAFRICERFILNQCRSMTNRIFDFGGGVVLHEDEMSALKNRTFIIYLESSADVLLERSCGNYYRPSLTGLGRKEEIEEVLKERIPLYEHFADCTIKTDGLSIDQCTERILDALQRESTFIPKQYLISREELLCESI